MTKLTVIIGILLILCISLTVNASTAEREMKFDVEELLDYPYRSGNVQFVSYNQAVSELSKGTLDFLQYSLLSIPEPISIISLQKYFITALNHVLNELNQFDNYENFLYRIGKRLKDDSSLSRIFAPNSIDRLLKMFTKATEIIENLHEQDLILFNQSIEVISRLIKITKTDFSSMEPEVVYKLFDELLEIQHEHLRIPTSLDLMEYFSISGIDVSNPSAYEILIKIEDFLESNDATAISCDILDTSELDDFDRKRLNLILNLTEFEIKRLHDFTIESFDHKPKFSLKPKSAQLVLEDNLAEFSKLPSDLDSFEVLKSYFMKVFSEPLNFGKYEIELISFFIQEPQSWNVLTEGKVKEFLSKLEGLDRIYLNHLYEFLSNEPIEVIQEILGKLFNYSEVKFDDLVISVILSLNGNFPLMKEFIFKELFGIENYIPQQFFRVFGLEFEQQEEEEEGEEADSEAVEAEQSQILSDSCNSEGTPEFFDEECDELSGISCPFLDDIVWNVSRENSISGDAEYFFSQFVDEDDFIENDDGVIHV